MILSKQEKTFNRQIRMNGSNLEIVKQMKYLGVDIDDELKFKEHHENTIKKLRKKVSILRRLRYSTPKKTKLLIFNAIVKPHTQYCNFVFTKSTEETFSRIQVTLNDGLRAILNPADEREPIKEMLKELDMIYFKDQVYLDNMTFIYKMENNLLSRVFNSWLTKNREIHEHSTRTASNYFLKINKRTHFTDCVAQYNKLKKEIKTSTSINSFRKKLKLEIQDGY